MKKTLQTCIIMGILLFSAFTVLMPSSSALKLQGNIKLEVGKISNERVSPNVGRLEIPLRIGYKISGLGAGIAYFANNDAKVQIDISNIPEWASVQVTPAKVAMAISETDYRYANATMVVTVNENAPALSSANIEVTLTADEIKGLGATVQKVTYGPERILFKPSYIPIIGYTIDNTLKEIAPGETADFDITLENLGNGKTEVILEITSDLPDGWIASVPSVVMLDSKTFEGEPTKDITLTVQPPYNFGYHNDEQVVRVKLAARYFADDGSLSVKEYPLEVTVKSRGFSTPGFEIAFVFIAMSLILLMSKKYKKQK